MKKDDFKKSIEELFQKTLELEKEAEQNNFSKIKIEYIKNSLSAIEEDLAKEKTGEKIEINEENIKEKIIVESKEKKEITEKEKIFSVIEKENEHDKILKEQIIEKKKREKTQIEIYIAENIKLLIFSTFIMIGLVWLFVYVTNLTNYSEELRVITGFIISIGLLVFEKVKGLKEKKSLIFVLLGYVIGLLVLLFGTISLEVIPKELAIIISLIYIGYGIAQVRKQKTMIYDVSIIATSLLLTFAYRYVEAPEYILYGYISLILISMTIVLKNQERKVTNNILIIGTMFITNIIGLFYEFKIGRTHNNENELKELLSSMTTQTNLMMPITILVIAAISYLYLRKEEKNNLIISSLYVSFFAQILRINDVMALENTPTLKILNVGLMVAMIIVFILAKKEKSKELSIFGKSTALITIMYVIVNFKENVGFETTLLLSIITLIVITILAIKEELYTLRFVAFINFTIIASDLIEIVEDLEKVNIGILTATILLFIVLNIVSVKYLSKNYKEKEFKIEKVFINKGEILIKTILMTVVVTIVAKDIFEHLNVHYSWLSIPIILLSLVMFYQSEKEKQFELFAYGIGYVVFQTIGMINFIKGEELIDTNYIYHGFVLIIFSILIVLINRIIKTEQAENEEYEKAIKFAKKGYLYISTVLSLVLITTIAKGIDYKLELNGALEAAIAIILGFVVSVYAIKEKDVVMKVISVWQQIVVVFLVVYSINDNLALNQNYILVIITIITSVLSIFCLAKKSNKNITKENQKWMNTVIKIYTQIKIILFVILVDGIIKNMILGEYNLWIIEAILLTTLIYSINFIFKKEKNEITSIFKFLYSLKIIFLLVQEIMTHEYWYESFVANIIAPIVVMLLMINIYRENKNINKIWMNAVLITYFVAIYQMMKKYTLILESYYWNSDKAVEEFVRFEMLFGLEQIFVIILMILFMYREKSKEALSITKIFIEISYIWTFVSLLFRSNDMYNESLSILLIEIIGVGLFTISIRALVKDFKEIDIRLMYKKINERTVYAITIPIVLISIQIVTSAITGITKTGNNIEMNMAVGLSIIYLIFESTRIEKIKPKLKKTIWFVYSMIGVYLYVLVFKILADTDFIIRAIVFILIGVYGLYTVVKKPKEEQK